MCHSSYSRIPSLVRSRQKLGLRKGIEIMPGACGVACEVCVIRKKIGCPLGEGCGPGTDPKAPERAEKIKAAMRRPCYILECAIKNNIDYCSSCDQFPCEVHYRQEVFSHRVLNLTKALFKWKQSANTKP